MAAMTHAVRMPMEMRYRRVRGAWSSVRPWAAPVMLCTCSDMPDRPSSPELRRVKPKPEVAHAHALDVMAGRQRGLRASRGLSSLHRTQSGVEQGEDENRGISRDAWNHESQKAAGEQSDDHSDQTPLGYP